MTHHEFNTCDDCGKRMPYDPPFTIERDQATLSEAPITHACSTACLVRLATAIHRRLPTGGGDRQD